MFTETGLVTANGDTITGVTETSTGSPVSATVGTYPIVRQRRDGTGSRNYTIIYVNGTLTVNPATLTITANNDSKTYGTLETFSGTSVHRDRPGDRQRRHHHRRDRDQHRGPVSATVGTYHHRALRRDGQGLSNYTIIYVNGTLTVNPASLTITANNDSKTYGTLKTFSTHGVHRDRPGDRQRRHHHRRDRDQHRRAGIGHGGHLSHRAQCRDGDGSEQLHHHLRQRHADGQPGGADHHGQRTARPTAR